MKGDQSMEYLNKYKGIRTTLPVEGDRLFRIALCFMKKDEETNKVDSAGFSLKKFIETHDAGLLRLLQAAYSDLKVANIRVYMGEPEEEMESGIKLVEKKSRGMYKFTGYLIFNRSAAPGPDDPMPESKEEWYEKAGEFKMTRQVRELFRYMDEEYFLFSKL